MSVFSVKAHRGLKVDGYCILPAYSTLAQLVELCREEGIEPDQVQIFGKYHAPTDNQSGVCLVVNPVQGEGEK
jgi:hypothetical protein